MTFGRFWLPRQVQQVNTHEDDQEPANQGDGLARIGRVESLEQNGACDDGRRGEEDVINGVDADR